MKSKTGRETIAIYAGDWLTAAVLLLLSFCVWFFCFRTAETGKEIAVIDGASRELARYSLDEPGEHIIRSENGYTLTILIKDGTALVADSDCENKICRDSAPISRGGQVIVCAPAHIRISVVTGGDAREDDFVAG